MKKWAYIRLALIAIGVALMLFSGRVVKQSTPPMEAFSIAVVFLSSIIGILFVIGIQSINKWSAKTWTKPSWNANPFSLRQPLQFFHFAAYFLLIGGAIQLIYTFLNSSSFIYEAAVGPIMGIGILLGVKLSEIIYAFKFRDSR